MKDKLFWSSAIAAVVVGALAFGSPALAGHGHGNGHGNPHSSSGDGDDDGGKHHHKHGKHVIAEHDRRILIEYIGHEHNKRCPPGLAKKHNGCHPPGQLKYSVGSELPRSVRYEMLPRNILESLAPAPDGTKYVRTGNDVYLMNKTDRIIMDAVTLLNDLQ